MMTLLSLFLVMMNGLLLINTINSQHPYPNRPTFHFVPVPISWMNDPNGPFYDAKTDKYHLFFQYGTTATGGPKRWGHAISDDLLRWINLPIALPNNEPYNKGGVWTGSTTQLPNPIGGHQIYIMYSVNTNNLTCLAYPTDPTDVNLTQWTNYPENCILNVTRDNCPNGRGPTHSWTADGGKTWTFTYNTRWTFQTTDWKTWTATGNQLFTVGGECPGFWELPKSQQFKNATHIIKVSRYKYGEWWAFGSYNATSTQFIPYQGVNSTLLCPDCSFDFGYPCVFYASKAFYDAKHDRQVTFGWLKEGPGQNNNGWEGAQSLPRTVTLLNASESPTGYPRVISYPIKEFDSLRIQSSKFSYNATIKSGDTKMFSVSQIAGNTLDIDVVWSSGGDCGVYVIGNGGASNNLGSTYTRIGVNFNDVNNAKTFYVQPNGQQATQQTVPGWDGKSPIKVRIIVDHSVVTAFINDGIVSTTRRVYQNLATYSVGVYAFQHNNGDSCVLSTFNAYNVTTVIEPPN
eukprot:94511_1